MPSLLEIIMNCVKNEEIAKKQRRIITDQLQMVI